MLAVQDKIIVKPFPSDNKTSGGIFLPDSLIERKSKATVVAAGKSSDLKTGEIVFHVKHAGKEVEIEGEKYFIIRDSDVLAILE